MRICYFGDYDPAYSRNRVLFKGLRENGVEIIECRSVKELKSLKDDCDFVIVGYSDARRFVPLARIFSRKPVVWDAFYSLYDSWVYDRKLTGPRSLKAMYYWFLDWINCKFANFIILDTDEHIKYFSDTFKINKSKFIRVFVGTDDRVFYPREIESHDKFTVYFHGNFIPLQGTKYIVQAASQLKDENINFFILGDGQEYKEARKLAQELNASNIEWHGRVDYDKLPEYMVKADVILGIFGDTPKTQRVIPNKIYEAAAMAKPVLTADTPAIRELFGNDYDILLCRTGNSRDLAAKIMELKNNSQLRNKISANIFQKFKNQLLSKTLASELASKLNGK